MVEYTGLWEIMKQKKVTQYRLIKYYGISAGQISRLKKNMHVSTHTLETLCNILQCPVEDIVTIRLDEVSDPKDIEGGVMSPEAMRARAARENGQV